MHARSTVSWKHEHTFGQEEMKAGEKSTRLVIMITGIMMVVEIAAGIITASATCTYERSVRVLLRRSYQS